MEAPEEGEDRLDIGTQAGKMCFRAVSPKHEHRRNKPIVAKFDAEQAVAVPAAAVAEGGRNMVDPVSGKALTDKKSQKMQVKQEQAQWGLGTRIHHPSHDDQ